IFQFHRHRPAKDRQLDAYQPFRLEQLLHFPFHAGEGAVFHLHAISAVVLGLDVGNARHVLALATLHPLDFTFGHGRRRMVQTAADEIAHAGGFPEEVEDTVIVFDFHHQVARIELALAHDSFAVAHLRHFFNRNDDLTEKLLQPFNLDAAFDRLLDRLFPTALHFDDVPTFVAL